jgi:sugar phosphate isomerase/epimerase
LTVSMAYIVRVCLKVCTMTEFSCADYTFPVVARQQALRLLQLLDFVFVDIGLFERSSHFLPSNLMDAPGEFTRRVQQDLDASELRVADVFLQIGRDPAESSTNDPDPIVRGKNREVFARALEFCKEIGGTHMTGLPGVPHDSDEQDFALAAEETSWRLEQCRRAGVVYAVEPHVGSICADTARTRELLLQVKGLTLTLDYGHFIFAGEESKAVHSLLPYASHVHARAGARGRLQVGLAENTIDFEAMLAGLVALQYPGRLAMEYVWVDWQGCNCSDTLSETILLRQRLQEILVSLNRKA